MIAFLDRVPVDEITTRAREVQPGRTVLLWLAAVLYALGWVVAKLFGVLWLGLTWSWTAVAVGWQEARHPKSPGDG